MERLIRRKSEEVLLRDYLIRAKPVGWFFRCDEVSNCVYRAEASDVWGRSVSHTGTDPDALIAACEEDAKSMAPIPGASD